MAFQDGKSAAANDVAEEKEKEPKKPLTRTEAVGHVRDTFDAWEKFKKKEGSVKSAATRSSEALKAAQEKFEKELDDKLPLSATVDETKKKLGRIAKAWEELKAAKTEGANKRKAAKDARAEAKETFETMMEECGQIRMLL